MKELLVLIPDEVEFAGKITCPCVIITTEGEVYFRIEDSCFQLEFEEGRLKVPPELDLNSSLVQDFLSWAFETGFLYDSTS